MPPWEWVVGLGMNAAELEANPHLTERLVQDLNLDPRLPYEDETFDVVTNCASVDYLVKPLEVWCRGQEYGDGAAIRSVGG